MKPHASARQLAKAIESWFARHARDLPWRAPPRTGYTALVSEAMLQQTQVSRVVEKYRDFLARFPTLADLAGADEQQVLAAWQGLGYYRRARHLHAAARMIVAEHGGEVPARAEALHHLPGVGRYTAGAIASIIFGERAPIVDGNVQRVLARVDADERSPVDREAVRDAWKRAEELVRASADPAKCNEGLMELGALICTPVNPKCEACPVRRMCAAFRTDRVGSIPPARPAARTRVLVHHAVVVALPATADRGRTGSSRTLLLEQRPSEGLWSTMWQVPTIEAEEALEESVLLARLRARVRGAGVGVRLTGVRHVEEFRHQTTHRALRFIVFRATVRLVSTRTKKSDAVMAAAGFAWREVDQVDDLPLSNPQRRIVRSAGTITPP